MAQMIHINPTANAEIQIAGLLRSAVPTENLAALLTRVMAVVKQAVDEERLLTGAHADCGEDNPDGKTAKCACPCHKGHYRHAWQPVIKTPQPGPDGTLYLLDRCRYCPDLKMNVIKTCWIGEQHRVVGLEYLIRGTQSVLTKEDWQSREVQPVPGEIIRRVKL